MTTFWGPTIGNVKDVAERNLCAGCGVCAYLEPDSVQMIDVVGEGRRPSMTVGATTGESLKGCPGISLTHDPTPVNGAVEDLLDGWGPVLEVWEGYSSDSEIRHRGSSGGAVTALALHAIEHEGMYGALHTAARPDAPLLNHTVMSRGRDEMLAATGSRYAPASPCDGLQQIEDAPEPCVFIGKPCDVAAVSSARKMRPALDAKVGLTIGIFCAGTPSTEGTLEMVRRMGIDDPEDVLEVRYRGKGWPGQAEVRAQVDGREITRQMTYQESWGDILQTHRQWRCRVCVDHTGEFADIAVGDPWYREIPENAEGRSLIVARTVRGQQILQSAIRSGALVAERVSDEMLPASQPNLLMTRGAVWGRVKASRLMGIAAPVYTNIPAHRIWWRDLSTKDKVRSILGTAKRIVTRGMYRRRRQG